MTHDERIERLRDYLSFPNIRYRNSFFNERHARQLRINLIWKEKYDIARKTKARNTNSI